MDPFQIPRGVSYTISGLWDDHCVDLQQAKPTGLLLMWPNKGGSANQKWKFERQASGRYRIVSEVSSPDKKIYASSPREGGDLRGSLEAVEYVIDTHAYPAVTIRDGFNKFWTNKKNGEGMITRGRKYDDKPNAPQVFRLEPVG